MTFKHPLLRKSVTLAVLFTMTSTSIVAFGAPGDGKKAQEAKPKQSSIPASKANGPEALFHTLINTNPAFEHAYDAAFAEIIKTGPDKQIFDTLMNSPALAPIIPMMEEGIRASTLQGIAEGARKMRQIQVGLDKKTGLAVCLETEPEVKALGERMIAAGRKLGWREEKMAEAKFFRTMGITNAWTTSADKDLDTFVVGDDLQDKSNIYGLEGVIEHEKTHILGKHVLKGALNTAMLMQLVRLYDKNGLLGNPADIEVALNPERYIQNNPNERTVQIAKFWQKAFDSVKLNVNTGAEGVDIINTHRRQGFYKEAMRAFSYMSEEFAKKPQRDNPPPKSSQTMSAAHNAIAQTFDSGMEQQQGIQILQNFVLNIVSVLSRLEMPYPTVDYFQKMADDLNNPINEDSPLRKLDVSEMIGHFMLYIGADSREMETTADNGARITPRTDLPATMFQTFGGSNVERLVKAFGVRDADGKKIVQSIRDLINASYQNTNANEKSQAYFYSNYSDRERRQQIGGDPGADHPDVNTRDIMFREFAQRLEIVTFRNPFMKLLVTEKALRENIADNTLKLKGFQKYVDQNKAQFSPEDLDQAKRVFAALNDDSKASFQADAQLSSALVKMVTESKKLDGSNPYLMDLMDWSLAQKHRAAILTDILVSEAKDIQAQIAKVDKADVATLQQLQSALDDIAKGIDAINKTAATKSPVVEQVAAVMERAPSTPELKRRLNLMKVVRSANNDLATITEARNEIASINQYRQQHQLIDERARDPKTGLYKITKVDVREMNHNLSNRYQTKEQVEVGSSDPSLNGTMKVIKSGKTGQLLSCGVLLEVSTK